MNTYEVNNYPHNDERLGLGGIGSGLGFFPGLGFGRPGFGFGRPGFGFGLPFFTGFAAGALLRPRPVYPPYPPYPPYQPYPPYYPCC